MINLLQTGSSSVITEMIAQFFARFEGINNTMLVWLSVGKIIGCIGAYIYIFKKFGSKILSGETFNLSDIGYPIFIAFLLSVYTPVATGIEKLFTSTYDANYIAKTVGQMETVVRQSKNTNKPISPEKKAEFESAVMNDMATNQKAEEYMKTENTFDAVNPIFQARKLLESTYQSIVDSVNDLILSAITTILEVVIVVCVAIIFFIAKLYITFLFIFGPFSIAMSLIPGFENSITNWFQKYITYCLWMPIAATISSLSIDIMATVYRDSTLNGEIINLPGAITALLCVSIMLIVSMLAVPKIASNVIATSIGSSSTVNRVMTAIQMRGGSGGSLASTAGGAVASGGVSTLAAGAAASATTGGSSDNSSNPAERPQV